MIPDPLPLQSHLFAEELKLGLEFIRLCFSISEESKVPHCQEMAPKSHLAGTLWGWTILVILWDTCFLSKCLGWFPGSTVIPHFMWILLQKLKGCSLHSAPYLSMEGSTCQVFLAWVSASCIPFADSSFGFPPIILNIKKDWTMRYRKPSPFLNTKELSFKSLNQPEIKNVH